MTNFLYFLISGWITLSVGCINKDNQKPTTQRYQTVEAVAQNGDKIKDDFANGLYYKLMNSFGKDWMERENDPDFYPAYYAGSFISDAGKFVINVTGNPEQYRQSFADRLGSNDFILQSVKYSYSHLLRVMNKIDAFLANSAISEDNPALVNFAGAYPDVVDNRVRVTMLKLDDTVTHAFKKEVSNSPAVVFEVGERPGLME